MPMAPSSQCQRRRPRVATDSTGSAGTQPILVPVQTPSPHGPHFLIGQMGSDRPSWHVVMGRTKMMSVRETGSTQDSAAPLIPHPPETRPLAVRGAGCVLHAGDGQRGTNGAEIWSSSISQATHPGVSCRSREGAFVPSVHSRGPLLFLTYLPRATPFSSMCLPAAGPSSSLHNGVSMSVTNLCSLCALSSNPECLGV